VGGIDLFGSETNFQDEASFDSRSRGFGLRFGFPLSDKSRFLMRYQFKKDDIYNVAPGASAIIQAAAGPESRSIIGYDYYLDERNDPIDPTAGWDFLFSQDFAGAGGTVRYLSNQVLVHAYHQFAEGYTGTQRLDVGYIDGIGQDVRVNDRFFKGGADFRGFKSGGIGPRDVTTNDALGAEAYAFATTEVTFPNGLPEALGVRTSLFSDYGYIGRAYVDPILIGSDTIKTGFAPRVSVGLSVNWKSPFGPVRLDFAKAVISQSYDQTQIFSFSAGTSF
ncbi:MAG: BamA/TamA family outer membrane protein, partial [Parvibaculum sp.]|uniref:BamA/TamA family outer membrane protein n=1 Tax=Parvibaculum sp. TaxID=2024848 RepID=UPI00284678A8